ncbi:hypothetical protein H6G41_27495 [Tolypothrix sp. FACHB-123]|nr:hypothetical protein [Tolypothrix sp. FACHB-123]
MQAASNSSNPAPRLQQFLNLIDRISDAQGLSVPQIVDIEKLRTLPPGTFGRTWVEFLNEHNLQPFTTGSRRKQLHDGVHTLTGYGTDSIGELEVQAFLLGAKFNVFNLLLGLGLLRMMRKQMPNLQQCDWQRLQTAYKRGHNSNFDPDTWKPELLWHLPTSEVQALFHISRSTCKPKD